MIIPAVLLSYAVLTATVGGRWLQAMRWPARSPLVGIWVWQALSASTVAAAVLAGMTLTVPVLPFGDQAAHLLHACWLAIQQRYSTAGGAAAATVGMLAAAAVIARLGLALLQSSRQVRRCRRRQRQRIALLAAPGVSSLVAVPDARSLVYCLPGRRGLVVYTTAAQGLLDPAQLQAVLAHERAHLGERHDLPLLGAAALRAAFPFVPAFRRAEAQICQLVEMRADDVAAAQHPRRVLAEALVLLAGAQVPRSALGAGGASAVLRCERLLGPRHPLGRRGLPIAVAGLALTVLPLLIAALPAAIALVLDYCPPGI